MQGAMSSNDFPPARGWVFWVLGFRWAFRRSRFSILHSPFSVLHFPHRSMSALVPDFPGSFPVSPLECDKCAFGFCITRLRSEIYDVVFLIFLFN